MDVPQRRAQYLQALGITRWVPRAAAVSCTAAGPMDTPAAGGAAGVRTPQGAPGPLSVMDAPAAGEGREARIARMDWAALEAEVAACTACDLYRGRNRPVFGTGDRHARLMLIGEAPGAEEDRKGEPFVGRAGQLLNAMLQAIGLSREQVYIANILKSRPPNNRDPRPEEIQACAPFLRRQIALIGPRLILALGRVAAQNLLQTEQRLGVLRGKVHRLPGTDLPVVVTYHPAYLLRTPQDKRKAWEDLRFAVKSMRE